VGAYGIADAISGGLGMIVAAAVAFEPGMHPLLNDLVWQVPLGAFLTIFAVRLVLSPYWTYKELEKENIENKKKVEQLSQPDFKLEVLRAISTYGGFGTDTFVSLATRIINRGTDSAILGWKVHYHSATFSGYARLAVLNKSLDLKLPNGSAFTLIPDNALFTKTGPIVCGDFRSGDLNVLVTGDKTREVASGEAVFTVYVTDYMNHETSFEFKGTGQVTEMRYLAGEKLPEKTVKNGSTPAGKKGNKRSRNS
jgi:hypothetical protein